MQKRLLKFILFFACIFFFQEAYTQSLKRKIGTTHEFAQTMGAHAVPNKKSGKKEIMLHTPEGSALIGEVNVDKIQDGGKALIGSVKGQSNSSYFFNISNTEVTGQIVLPKTKKAYTYTTSNGEVYVEETDINKVLCVEYNSFQNAEANNSELPQNNIAHANSTEVLSLESLPSAPGVLYLDADGEVVTGTLWNGGNTINAQSANLSDAALREAWEMVAEDFRALNINVTTNRSVYDSYPQNRRMMVIITPTNFYGAGVGGVAYLHSFGWNNDTPCWSFITNNARNIGVVSSHEFGHTLGLTHDGRTSPQEAYYAGHGNWAPIMGVGYSRSITHWSKGEYANANNTQDDLAIMSGPNFGVGLRNDDHANINSQATELFMDSIGNLSEQNIGVIERNTDIDVFKFSTGGGSTNLTFSPVYRHANLNILVNIYNEDNQLIRTINPPGVNAAAWDTTLNAGTYYIHISGTGEGNVLYTGFSDYSSLGEYSIRGTIANPGTENEPPVVVITAPDNGATFESPANINITATASDPDGYITKVEFYSGNNKLGESTSSPYQFNWTGVPSGTYSLTAIAYDNSNRFTVSEAVNITVNSDSTATCTGGVDNGDYTYEVSTDNNITTVTFIPGAPIAGSTASLLYYRINNGALMGTFMDAEGSNFTKSFPTSNGDVISFYFTYRVGATSVERNSSATPHTITVGECGGGGDNNTPPTVVITSPANGQTFASNSDITITANASDTDGTVSRVEFYAGNNLLGIDYSSPYAVTMSNTLAGTYKLTAIAFDNENASTVSDTVTITVISDTTGICTGGVANGDYTYEASTSNGTTTIKFIPGAPIAGSTMCILYYRINNGATMGVFMNAEGSNFTRSFATSSSDVITFYFTYRVGNTGVERNSSATPHTITAGECGSNARLGSLGDISENIEAEIYPNPAQDVLNVMFTQGLDTKVNITITDMSNRIVFEKETNNNAIAIDVNQFANGVYIMHLQNDSTKIVKKFLVKK